MSRAGHGENPPGGWEPLYGEPQYGEPTSPFAPFGPPGDTQRYPQPSYNQPPYGQQYTQPYPHAGYGPPGSSGAPPQYTAPPPGERRNKALLWGIVAVVVAAGLGIGGFFLFAGNAKSGSAAPATVAPSVVLPTPPSISVPSISVPSLSLPAIPAFNVCSGATSAEQAALLYVSAAELGQVDLAQACVYHDQVSRSVTESIHTGGALYSVAGQTGSTVRFRNVDGSSSLSVTVTRESDGNYWITAVKKS